MSHPGKMPPGQKPPFNPATDAVGDEQIPAKIWELLRRNEAFCARVRRLKQLDTQARNNRKRKKTRAYHNTAWEKSAALVRRVGERHPLAEIALQWLVPDPWFLDSRKAPTGQLQDWEGLSPDLEHPSWKCNDGGHRGGYERRGLIVCRSSGDRIDPFAEWEGWRPETGWSKGRAWFDCTTCWRDTPDGFKQAFRSAWTRGFDRKKGYETDFFRGWGLTDLQPGLAQGDLDIIAKAVQFDELASAYRVFAIPATALTPRAVRAAFEECIKMVSPGFPTKREHFFGARTAWRDFFAVADLPSGFSKAAAVKENIRSNYKGGQAITLAQKTYAENPTRENKRALQDARTEAQRANQSDVTDRINFMHSLRDRIFPAFNLPDLLRPMKSKNR